MVKKVHRLKNKSMNKSMKWKIIVPISICIIIFVFIILFALRAHSHYVELKSHRDYFKQPNPPIQEWMTIHSVVRYYNLSESKIYSEMNISPDTLNMELGIDNSTIIDRLTIETICAKKHLDCNSVVDRLNSIRD